MSAPPKHREAIVTTAAALFRKQGYASTGLNEILSESGAPKGSLYHYFPKGKEEVGEAAVRFAADKVTATLEQLEATTKSAAVLVTAYCNLLSGWMTKSGFEDGCPIATTLLETAPASEGVTRAGRQAFFAWQSILARALVRDGLARKEASRLARTAVAAIEGALIEARVLGSREPIDDVATVLAVLMRKKTRAV